MNRIAKFFRDYALARFLLPAGIIAVIFGILTVGPVASRLNYPTTQAAVSRTELYEEAHYEDDTRHDATYTVFVRYAVDGVEYEEEYGVFPAMQKGQAITINYNPDDPRDIGQPNSMLLPYGVIAAGVLALAGGVSANRNLRDMLQRKCEKKGVRFCCPDFKYCTDNAAMIGSAGFYLLMNGCLSDLDLNATPYLPIC